MLKSIKFTISWPVPTLLLVFCLAEVIINPLGNFPLNDDWWYARLFYSLSGKTAYHGMAWPSAAFFGQYLFACIVTFFLGDSLTSLRFSVLCLSGLSIIIIYLLALNHLHVKRHVAFFLALLLLFNPVFLCLSNSFMSDVPFLFYSFAGIYHYFNYNKYNFKRSLWYALLFFSLALLTRQLAIAFIIPSFLNLLYKSRKTNTRAHWWFLLPLVSLLVFECWLKQSGRGVSYAFVFFENQGNHADSSYLQAASNFVKRWTHYATFTGLVLSPALIPYLLHHLRLMFLKKDWKLFSIALLFCLPALISLRSFPIGNYLYNIGNGPETLYDYYLVRENTLPLMSGQWMFALKWLAALGSCGLIISFLKTIQALLSVLKNKKQLNLESQMAIFFILSMAIYYTLLCLRDSVFDRYMIPFAVLSSLVIYRQVFNATQVLNYLIVLGLALFAVFSVKDYLQSNRLRWQMVEFLKHEYLAKDSEINAGYEHAGFYFGNQSPEWFLKWQNRPPSKYLIARGFVNNYQKMTYFTTRRYLPYKTDTIYILKSKYNTPN